MTQNGNKVAVDAENSEGEAEKPKSSIRTSKLAKRGALIVLALALLPLTFAGYIYAASPAVIREPKLEHYHFRMQILVDGEAENFAEDTYQKDYAKDQCNGSLTEQPIHFHDGVDQFTHIHWEGMTGGMVMKYYGWNFIGGVNNALGYKLDDLGDIQKVNTHGNFLPDTPEEDKFYVYVGDEDNYQEKSFDDWVDQDLEEFFGKTSNFPAHEQNQQSSLFDKVFPKAYAHGGIDDGDDGETGEETEEQRLTRINNLVGNVVIFVQDNEPTDQQIRDRFDSLVPLTDSTCGG